MGLNNPNLWILVLITLNIFQFIFNLLFVAWLWAQLKDDTTTGGIPLDRLEKYQEGKGG